jgi:hypothetical protein
MKLGLMKSVGYFLSGDMVRNATIKALDGFFDKRAEPRYRSKAREAGIVSEFERHLIEFRDRSATHASLRAYKLAKQRHHQA